MNGYEILLVLYCNTETWREIKIPGNINLKQFHKVIQKLFGFHDYHNWQFKIPARIDDEHVDLGDIVKYISSDDSEIPLKNVFDKHDILIYEYDFGDSWEIIVNKTSEIDYENKTALIIDYNGKYNPMDDLGGPMIFDEVMESIDEEELEYVLDEYNLSRGDLSKMDFEKKYKKGSRIKISK